MQTFDLTLKDLLMDGAPAESLLASDHPCDIIMALFVATDDIRARVRAVIE